MHLSPEEIDILRDPTQHAAGGPARTFLDELPHPGPVPNVQVIELFRQLAILYLRRSCAIQILDLLRGCHLSGVRTRALDRSETLGHAVSMYVPI
jgi:hypothetical protein